MKGLDLTISYLKYNSTFGSEDFLKNQKVDDYENVGVLTFGFFKLKSTLK